MNIIDDEIFEIVIIGAGPSGLAAGYACAHRGHKTMLLEAGPSLDERSYEHPEEIVTGSGGAGLWSDGKFSFFPSASALWGLHDNSALREAYSWLEELLNPFDIKPPSFPTDTKLTLSSDRQSGILTKEYPSFYLPFKDRKEIIRSLQASSSHFLNTRCEVIHIETTGKIIEISYRKDHQVCKVLAKTVILSCGRFGSLRLPAIAPHIHHIFQRYEFGLRIEQPAEKFFLKDSPYLDPKKIIESDIPGVSWRTFCACRNGEVVETSFIGLRTLSGRSDNACSGKSNVGFNVRILDRDLDSALRAEIERTLAGHIAPFRMPIESYLSGTAVAYGPNLDHLLRSGLQKLFNNTVLKDTYIAGPCIEGVGCYPEINDNLKVPNAPIWVAGDQSGLFRGLTAALLSGYYAGIKASEHLDLMAEPNVYLKGSPTEPMPVVFTAQSKAFFYCRDAVCEYTFKEGRLPLNPFRVFEYFLGDRVDRNLIRRGNNQLLHTAQEVWVFGPIADGVLFEIALARQLNKPVKFFNIATRMSEIHQIDISEVRFEPEVHARQINRSDLIAFITGDPSMISEKQQKQMPFLFKQ